MSKQRVAKTRVTATSSMPSQHLGCDGTPSLSTSPMHAHCRVPPRSTVSHMTPWFQPEFIFGFDLYVLLRFWMVGIVDIKLSRSN
eukprot:2817851-Amphidinium_carterae.1